MKYDVTKLHYLTEEISHEEFKTMNISLKYKYQGFYLYTYLPKLYEKPFLPGDIIYVSQVMNLIPHDFKYVLVCGKPMIKYFRWEFL